MTQLAAVDEETFLIRPAHREDVAAIVAMLADDAVGGHGDTTDPAASQDYLRAFDAILDGVTGRRASRSLRYGAVEWRAPLAAFLAQRRSSLTLMV